MVLSCVLCCGGRKGVGERGVKRGWEKKKRLQCTMMGLDGSVSMQIGTQHCSIIIQEYPSRLPVWPRERKREGSLHKNLESLCCKGVSHGTCGYLDLPVFTGNHRPDSCTPRTHPVSVDMSYPPRGTPDRGTQHRRDLPSCLSLTLGSIYVHDWATPIDSGLPALVLGS